MNIFIFGNGNIRFSDFLEFYEKPLRKYSTQAHVSFSVCDFRGVDILIMELLKSVTQNVTLYHIGERPRYLPDQYKTTVGQWQLCGGFADDRQRDLTAIENCTHFLARDFNSSSQRKSGTLSNIELCEKLDKVRIT
ncbi:hypothetical protein AAG747_18750 [Rapidithrix thailandica]|uniref:Uncharacterized protein n=1 Tax=Rapidithrix thailandica TaxID=413964 RepID=A0AAW9RYI1_9BACT